MKWNRKPEPEDNQIEIRNKFAWFPVSVVVLDKDQDPTKVFKWGRKFAATKYVWLESYLGIYEYHLYSTTFLSEWRLQAKFIVE